MNTISRRQLLEGSLALVPVALLPAWDVRTAVAAAEPTTFFVTADPQINIPKWGTAGTARIIMNELPGKAVPPGDRRQTWSKG